MACVSKAIRVGICLADGPEKELIIMTDTRKVFISSAMLGKDNLAKYRSDNFDLQGKEFQFPISYMLEQNVEQGDRVLLITNVKQTEYPQRHYKELQAEAGAIAKAHGAEIEFVEVKEYLGYDGVALSSVFKQVADLIQDGDRLYADLTFGTKAFTFAVFIGLAYAAKAGRDVDMDTLVYAEMYRGDDGKPAYSKLMDITSLFYINSIVGDAVSGQKDSLDKLLSMFLEV